MVSLGKMNVYLTKIILSLYQQKKSRKDNQEAEGRLP